jgi:hypothetical protein
MHKQRRRTKVIPHAFGELEVLKLMQASLIRASQSWRSMIISGFRHWVGRCAGIAFISLGAQLANNL